MCPGALPNLIITGFMGSGKSRVGKMVARKLGWRFVDMDRVIEKRAQKSILRIFAEDGEPAFRAMEAALVQELGRHVDDDPRVISTGGGTLVDPKNREIMLQAGTVVCLTVSIKEMIERIHSNADKRRPLLGTTDPESAARQLWESRRPAYERIPWQVDTAGLLPEEIVERVAAIACKRTLTIDVPGGAYPIHIGKGLLDHIGSVLRANGVPKGGRIALVSNPVVAPLYARRVDLSLRSAGLNPFICSLPDGEINKTLASVASLYDQFLEGELDRTGTVLALGGGVTGDMAGFAAASFMRGVRFAQVPTTLLSMVDASVGGKTGVDLPQGKNLVGAFLQPIAVLIDPDVLSTLPPEELRSGVGETIKHGVLGDPYLFSQLAQFCPADDRLATLEPLIDRAIRVKIEVVNEDPFEMGRRVVLNLGHTVGHALEQQSQFNLRHGEGVSIGMVAASRIAVALGLAEPGLVEQIENALLQWELPIKCPAFDVVDIYSAMTHDKKRQGKKLRWILPRAIGIVDIHDDVPRPIVESVLREMGAC